MIRIENKRTYRGAGVYIGRPSLLGNPYYVSVCGRRKAIMLYRRWLWYRIKEQGEIYSEMKRLAHLAKQGDLTLVCYCKPDDCHGDIVRSALEKWDAIEATLTKSTRRPVAVASNESTS
jgi:hypothetical protein